MNKFANPTKLPGKNSVKTKAHRDVYSGSFPAQGLGVRGSHPHPEQAMDSAPKGAGRGTATWPAVSTAPRPRTGARQTPTAPASPGAPKRGAAGGSGNQGHTMKRNRTPKSAVCEKPPREQLGSETPYSESRTPSPL